MGTSLDTSSAEKSLESEFFEEKSDEIQQILVKYRTIIEEADEQKPIVNIMDFCGGDGRFLQSLILSGAFSLGHKMELVIIEPDLKKRLQAISRLSQSLENKIVSHHSDLKDLGSGYNLIMVNSGLHHFENLREQIVKLVQALDYGGRLIFTIKRFDHPIVNLIEVLSQHKNKGTTQNSAMQLFHLLYEFGFYYDTHDIYSELRFPNSQENRNRFVSLVLRDQPDLYTEPIVNNFFDINTYSDEVVIALKDQIIVVHS
jgi:hypothetical protein